MIPMIFDEGKKRQLPWNKLADLIATTPARIFGLYPKKGTIQVGSDADMFLYNPDEPWVVKKEGLLYKQPWTPYENMKMRGRVKRTWIRGITVHIDDSPRGDIMVDPGFGAFLPGNVLN